MRKPNGVTAAAWERFTNELTCIGEDPANRPLRRVGFEAARLAKGILPDHAPEDRAPYLEPFCEEREYAPETFAETFCLSWYSVKCPMGLTALQVAYEQLREGPPAKMLPGKWATKRLHRDASLTYHLAATVAETCQELFLPCRALGEVLGTPKERSAQSLSLLCARGFLKKVGDSTPLRAQRFKVVRKAKSNTENLNRRTEEPTEFRTHEKTEGRTHDDFAALPVKEAARTAVDEWRSYLIERWTPEGPGDLPPPPPSNDPRLWEVFWAAAEGRIIL